jgi:GTP pyrophosphokinase
MFTEQVFVFTPKGEVLDLPKGSTPVDFAFRVHTEMGLTTVGAKINGIMSPLSTKLKNGDIVELITQKNAMPSPDWLKYVRSSHARNKLRAFFRKINKEDDAARGKGILEKELKRQHVNERELMNEDKLSAIAHNYPGCKTAQDVLAGIGNGLISVMNVATRLRGQTTEPKRSTIKTQQTNEGKVQLRADGVDNVMLRRARCCDPVPGEDVIGYVTRGRGIQIHRKICPNGMALFEDEPERFIDLDWPPDGTQYPVTLLIQTADRQGLLGDISQVLSDKKVNIAKGSFRSLRQHTAEIAITIDVDSLAKLNDVVQRIAQFQDVFNVLRTGKSKDR